MKVIAVIGGNYGDEGKGMFTHYFTSANMNKHPLVIRHNGGAQAGHTVYRDGQRFVFSHFGSGSLLGVPSFMATPFVCNPIIFQKERESLINNGINPYITVMPGCRVTTIYDMAYNQIIEGRRSRYKRHGSCGMGFNATIERNEVIPFSVADLFNPWNNAQIEKLQHIRSFYLKVLGEERESDRLFGGLKTVFSEDHIRQFRLNLDYFSANINVAMNYDFLRDREVLIFEGAQGLLLDMDEPDYPYLTRSKTGLHNVKQVLDSVPHMKYDLEAVYVTRPYLTRHGEGPIEEWDVKSKFNVIDETNVPNAYQGTMRYGLLDTFAFRERCYHDMAGTFGGLAFTGAGYQREVALAMSCFDQLGETVPYLFMNKMNMIHKDDFFFKIAAMFKYISYGNDGMNINKKNR